MMRLRHTLAAAIVLAALAGGGAARAGVLSKVVEGLSKASGDGKSGEGSGGSSGGGDAIGAVVSGLFSGDWSGSSRSASDPTYVYTPAYYPYAGMGPEPTEVSFYAGIQSVEGSDGGMTMELAVTYHDFGIALRGTGFYETVGSGDGQQHVQLDLGTMGAVYRVYNQDLLQVWLEGGLGGVSATGDIHVWGLFGGVKLTRKLGGDLAMAGELRHFRLEDDITANEARASMQISLLRVSYRVVDFNVGPALMGPEVGVALTF
jgi:hypothetical protein